MHRGGTAAASLQISLVRGTDGLAGLEMFFLGHLLYSPENLHQCPSSTTGLALFYPLRQKSPEHFKSYQKVCYLKLSGVWR